jgi:dolichol-phosphate mannosyltransferase
VKIAVLIPTYNEVDNIALLLAEIDKVVEKAPQGNAETQLETFTAVVIDSSSPDGTAEVARKVAQKLQNLQVEIISGEKQGLGVAYLQGFRYALEQEFDFIIQMDADFSHPPQALLQFLEYARRGNEFAVASRYTWGGSTSDWSKMRRIVSRIGNLYINACIHFAKRFRIKDMTGGFNMFSKNLLREILPRISETGYTIQIQLKFFALARLIKLQEHAKVVEFPIEFRERVAGVSKIPAQTFINTVRTVEKLRKIKKLEELPLCCR